MAQLIHAEGFMVKIIKPQMLALAASIAIAGINAHAAGFQHDFASDPAGKPLEIGIWYPSAQATQPLNLGPTTMSVAAHGPIQGENLPLVVMSHGTGSSFLGHFDTAIALADAGYVVAAITHTGDNYADQSRSLDIMDRPRQISRVIDHMLTSWSSHTVIDPKRIGMFGFSAGGFTTLVSIGGVPDFSKIEPMCRDYPNDFACQLRAKSPKPTSKPVATAGADARIAAAVVVAPALGFTFAPDGLKNVTAPVQLWRAEDDTLVPHPRYAETGRLALPKTPEYHVVPHAGHFDFLAPCSKALASLAPEICVSAPGFDRIAFHTRFNASVVGFFNKSLPVH